MVIDAKIKGDSAAKIEGIKQAITTNSQRGSALTDTLVKLVLIFFISLLSFSVGTFVGKQFADGQRKYASLDDKSEAKREAASVAGDVTEVKPEEVLTDEDIASLTEEFVKAEKEKGKDIMKRELRHEEPSTEGEGHSKQASRLGDSVTEGGRTIKVVASTHKSGGKGKLDEASGKESAQPNARRGPRKVAEPEESSEPAERVAQGEPPTRGLAAEKRQPSSLPPTTTTSVVGKYTVQIGAYASEGEARKRVQDLKEKGFSAFTVTAQKNGKNWYRVGVGIYSTQKDAFAAREDLSKQNELKDSFVQKIVQ